MQTVSRALRRVSVLSQRVPSRRGLASGVEWKSRRWAEITRAEAAPVYPDDPPVEPLSENHEIGDGQSDFANWIETHPDVSTRQAVTGLGFALGSCFIAYHVVTRRAKRSTPLFVPREFPTYERDVPGGPPLLPRVPE